MKQLADIWRAGTVATIRDANPGDAQRLLEIYSFYVENTAVTFEYDTPTLEEFSTRMKTIMERYPYLVAEQDGRIAGYAHAGPFHSRAAYGWCCEVTVYLDPGGRRRGMGRALYGAIEDALREMGILNLYACIAWPQQEDEYLTRDSAAFHARLGYRTVGEFRECGYKFGRWYGMIWMEKIIGEHGPSQRGVRTYPEITADCENLTPGGKPCS